MPALVVPEGARCRTIWTISGTPWAVVTFGARAPAGTLINQSIANNIGAAVKSALTSSGLGALLHSTVSLATFGIRDLRNPNLPELVDGGAAAAGTGTGVSLPLQTAFCITLRTALAGRSYRGRMYLGGFAAAANAGSGAAVAGVSTSGVAFVTAIQSALASSGLTLAVISNPKFDDAGAVVKAGFVNNVTLIQARDSVWDTQRRRQIPGI